jgi:hypothetical protein
MAQVNIQPGETYKFEFFDRCIASPPKLGNENRIAFCVQPNQVEASAHLLIGALNANLTSNAISVMEFRVTQHLGKETVLDATVSATVDWKGILYGLGFLGAGASVTIEMFLVDETNGTTKGQFEVTNMKQNSGDLVGIDIGGTVVEGAKTFSFDGSVVRGHLHSIRMKLSCQAESGLIGADIACLFLDTPILLGGHAKWTQLAITIKQDIFERLDQIDAKLEQMDQKLDEIDQKQDEVIRLLLTPQGQRRSDFIECESNGNGVGGGCDFPSASGNAQTGNAGAASAEPSAAVAAVSSSDQSSNATRGGSAFGLLTIAVLSTLGLLNWVKRRRVA